MTQTHFSLAVELNNRGACLLASRKYEEALSPLTHSLHLVKKLLRKWPVRPLGRLVNDSLTATMERRVTGNIEDDSCSTYDARRFNHRGGRNRRENGTSETPSSDLPTNQDWRNEVASTENNYDDMHLLTTDVGFSTRDERSWCCGNQRDASESLPSTNLRQTRDQSSCASKQRAPASSPASRGFIFDVPISIDPHEEASMMTSKGKQTLVKLSIILFYNLALTQHLRAIRFEDRLGESSNGQEDDDGDNDPYSARRQVFLLRTKALKLYTLAYRMQKTKQLELDPIHRMAVINNLSQIHAANEHKRGFMACRAYLLKLLIFYADSGKRDIDDGFRLRIEVEHPQLQNLLDGFFENVSSLILKNRGLAPAA